MREREKERRSGEREGVRRWRIRDFKMISEGIGQGDGRESEGM